MVVDMVVGMVVDMVVDKLADEVADDGSDFRLPEAASSTICPVDAHKETTLRILTHPI